MRVVYGDAGDDDSGEGFASQLHDDDDENGFDDFPGSTVSALVLMFALLRANARLFIAQTIRSARIW